MQYHLQQVIDLTSLMGRLDGPAIQSALLNAKDKTPFYDYLAACLKERRDKRTWQLKTLKKLNLLASMEDLKAVQDTLFDNKIGFKMFVRTVSPAFQKVGHSPFYLKHATRMNEGRWA